MKAKKSGMIILGGGIVKHHICNANLMVSLITFVLHIIKQLNYRETELITQFI